VLVFLPSLGSPVARSILASLQSRVEDFDLAGVGLYALTRSGLRAAQDFVPRHHLLFPLIADPEGRIFSLYGLSRLGLVQAFSSLDPRRAKKGLGDARYGLGRPERGLLQAPCAFAIGTGGTVKLAYSGRSLWEAPPLDALLAKARS